MNIDQWLSTLGVSAAWTMILGGAFRFVHGKNVARLDEIVTRIDKVAMESAAQHAAARAQAIAEHTAIAASIKDMTTTINEEFVHRREFEMVIRNLDGGLLAARNDIGAVGNKVDKMSERIDRLIERYS